MAKTAYELAKEYIGIKEVAGDKDNPQILEFLNLERSDIKHDETPWCSAFTSYIAKKSGLPYPKNYLHARSWLTVGTLISIDEARVGYDVVVLKSSDNAPGPEVIDGVSGHVGFFGGRHGADTIFLLSGNHSNSVDIAVYPINRILGVRRLKPIAQKKEQPMEEKVPIQIESPSILGWLKILPKILKAKKEFKERGLDMQLKEGKRTSEFLLVLLGIIITFVYPAIKEFYSIPDAYILAIDGLIGIYTGGRSYAKGKLTNGK